jgi:hypothetical protein
MIVATIVGGPRCGENIALENPARPIVIARPRRLTGVSYHEEQLPLPTPEIDTFEIRPRLTPNGWRLYWPKGQG